MTKLISVIGRFATYDTIIYIYVNGYKRPICSGEWYTDRVLNYADRFGNASFNSKNNTISFYIQ